MIALWYGEIVQLKLKIRNSTINSIAFLAAGQPTLVVIQQTPPSSQEEVVIQQAPSTSQEEVVIQQTPPSSQEEVKTQNLLSKSDRDYLATVNREIFVI